MTRGPEATTTRACPGPRIALTLLAVLIGAVLPGQVITRSQWGFDNRVVRGEFNLLTVDIRNDTDRPVDKTLVLTRTIGALRVGAVIEQRCYLGPNSSRTIRLYPFVESPNESWSMSWKEGGAPAGAPGIRFGPPALVFLEADQQHNSRMHLHRFDPEALPTNPLAMASLRAVVLDTRPDLNQRQRLALREWVRMGGVIHLLRGASGYPELTEELADLNPRSGAVRLGSGLVVRERFTRDVLQDKIDKVPKHLWAGFQSSNAVGRSVVSDFRGRLRTQGSKEQNWGLIFLLTLVYLLLVGPVFYRVSATGLSWHVGFLSLAGVIALATWLFMLAGARGVGEKDDISAYVYARSDGESSYEVTRYANVFVTGDSTRQFTATGTNNLFSSAQDGEIVPGTIHNGAQGRYDIEIPRFSNRMVVHKSTVSGPPLHAAYAVSGGQPTLTTALGFDQVVEVVGSDIYTWRRTGDGRWTRGARLIQLKDGRTFSTFNVFDDVADSVDQVLAQLLVHRLHLEHRDEALLVPTRTRHEFFARLPEVPDAFGLAGPSAGPVRGKTIIHFDVYDPDQ